ncbi:MAG: Type II secretion system protein D precursor [Syntrophaceae bacterium PtaU1.Bin231]|nr:MAG: Type II secretion system protein D precursor [Syntrophaceae bacterium PtaU1.Bin231]
MPDRRFLTILFAAGILFGGMADPFVPIRGGGVCLAQAPANPAPEAEPGRRQVPLPGPGGPQAVKTAPPSSAPMAADPAPAAEPPRQQELLPSRGGPQPVTAPPGTIRAPSAAAAARRDMFNLNFDDADIYTIIQTIFGEVLKANYVVDPRVKGRVTFRAVAPVPASSVLPLMEVILRLNGVGIVKDGDLYRIVPISDISKEPSPVSYGRDPAKIETKGTALLQVVPILHIQSSEVLKLITPFASTNAVLIDVPKGNQIILVDTDANVKRMLSLIALFDNDGVKQKKPQVFVYKVQNSKAKDIASLLQQVFMGKSGTGEQAPPSARAAAGSPAYSSSSAPSAAAGASQSQVSVISAGSEARVAEFTKIISDDITNTVVVMSTPEDYDAIKKVIEQIDIVPRQVIIEGMIASIQLTDNLKFGLAALFKGGISGFNTSAGINPGTLTATNPAALTQAGFTFLATDAAGTVRSLITGLVSDSRAKVLASPHILVSDNRDAKIQVGQQIPLISSETYGAVGVTPQRNYQYRDIGIILKVKPRINEGGLVSLELYQEISTFEKVNLGGTDQLLLNKTDASTNLVVQDGQTIIIGGLIREDITNTGSGVPFLSKIPLIGWLFGGFEDDKKRSEIIILLTPNVIRNQKDAKDLSRDYIDSMSEASEGRIRMEELLRRVKPRPPADDRPSETPGNAYHGSP